MAAREIALVIPDGAADEVACFEDLLRTTERPILRLCFRLLGNLADAQDAAQEVFLKAYRHRARMIAGRDPSPWLYQIAVNVCRDQYRRRRPAGPIEQALLVADGMDPCSAAERAESKRIVFEALDQLADREREALVLRELEGLDTARVAALMGVSEGTVRSHASLARAKLKAYVQERLKR